MRPEPLGERLALIVIADPEAVGERDLVDVVRATLQVGAPAVQLRAKRMAARETVALGRALAVETRRAGALLFVNDRIDIALVIEADGAHLGDDDLPLTAARSIVRPEFILGRSVDTVEDARAADAEGADYLGLGPVYATASKPGLPDPIGPEGVRLVVAATRLPVVGIGGIEANNVGDVIAAGAAGVAAIRSVVAASEPARAAAEILSAVRAARGGRLHG